MYLCFLVHILEGRRGRHALADREGQTVRLTWAVIRVLANYHHLRREGDKEVGTNQQERSTDFGESPTFTWSRGHRFRAVNISFEGGKTVCDLDSVARNFMSS